MSITYPLTPPSTDDSHSSIVWYEHNAIGFGQSPFSLKTFAHHWGGERWEIEVGFDPMGREQAAEWISFFSKLRGSFGTFRYGDVKTATPQGVATGTPLVKGGSQTGYELDTDGWTGSITGILKAGDRIQIGDALYRIENDADSDGSGNATLDIWPALRGHADNAPIITSNAKGLFRLDPGSVVAEEIGRSQFWQFAFRAVEAL